MFGQSYTQPPTQPPTSSCYLTSDLATVFQRLNDAGLRVNRQKCCFFETHVEYCGHGVSARGLHKTPAKVDAIVQAPRPTNTTQLRSFLGLVNYYQRFLPNSATLLHPLNALLQHGSTWTWSTACENAFQTVKQQLASDLVLTHFDSKLPIYLACDASPYGIGAVMSHVMPNGEERPIAFASRTLSKAERNYAQIDKEALAIVWGIKKFHTYLYGRSFKLITDHKPLTAIFNPAKHIPAMTAARLQRFALFLSGYHYEIVYRQTTQHANADGLSRLPLDTTDYVANDDNDVEAYYTAQVEQMPLTAAQVKRETSHDPVLSKVLQAVQSGSFDIISDQPAYYARREELSSHQGCLLWGSRVVIPPTLQHDVLSELHNGHAGIVRTKELARSYVWWPRIDQEIEHLIRSCSRCQQHQRSPGKAPLHPWAWPSRPWQRLHLDFAGPFLDSMWLVLVDARTKWPEVVEMPSTTSARTIEALRTIFARFGLPEQIVTDNGPQFVSEEFQHFLKVNGIQHIRSAPYHPATNGLAERFVQTFKHAMRVNSSSSLNQRLQQFLLMYRSTPHATTHETPAMMLLNRPLRTCLDLLRPQQHVKVEQQQLRQAEHHTSSNLRTIPVGTNVIVRDYRPQQSPWITGRVTAQNGLMYTVEIAPQVFWKRHIDQIKTTATTSSALQQPTIVPETLSPSSEDALPTKDTPSTAPTPSSEQPVFGPQPRRYPLRVRKAPERFTL